MPVRTPDPPVATGRDDGLGVAVAGAAVAVSVWGLSGVVVKNIDMGGLAIGAYRFGLYSLVVAAIMAARGTPITVRVLRHSFWGGVALAADVALFFTAVKLTTVVNATVTGALQPVIVSAIAARFFGERIDRRDVALAAVALTGAVVVVIGSSGRPEWNIQGDLAAVGALLAWSAYFVFSKHSQERISPAEYTAGAAIYTAAINAPLAALFGQSLGWPTAESWLWIAVLAFGAGVLGHSLMNWSLRQMPLWVASTMTLLIPVMASIAAWVFLDEPLNAVQVVAMALVLAALAGIVTRQAGIGSVPRPLRR